MGRALGAVTRVIPAPELATVTRVYYLWYVDVRAILKSISLVTVDPAFCAARAARRFLFLILLRPSYSRT